MKTFLWENRLRLLLLGIPVLCLIVLWNINIYKIWYDHTPWKNLGSPPSSANKIIRAGFTGSSLDDSRPIVSVLDRDINTYRCCYLPNNTWKKTNNYPSYSFPPDVRVGDEFIGLVAERKWNITNENNSDVVESISFGKYDGVSYEYVAYQIKQDGTIWEKYIDGRQIDKIQKDISAAFFSFMVLSAFSWVSVVKKADWGIKIYLQGNTSGLLLLSIPILCLVVLWNVNINKIWYDRTPWKNLGAPPSQVVKIYGVEFPHNYNFPQSAPELMIYAEDRNIYSMDWKGQWDAGHLPNYLEFDRLRENNLRSDEIRCIRKIQRDWDLNAEQDRNAIFVEARGSCAYYSFDSDQYVVFKIDQSGTILGKYVNGQEPRNLRKRITFYLCLFLILSAPVWTRIFIDFDFLKPKSDYEAK